MAVLEHDLPANGPREHYMRAYLQDGGISVFPNQDSSLLSILSSSNALAIRPPRDPVRKAGEQIEYIAF
jgi:molybdopterin molybdotransferase